MTNLLAGKTAIITGARKGIGRATADLFAAQGARLALTARSDEEVHEVVAAITAAVDRGDVDDHPFIARDEVLDSFAAVAVVAPGYTDTPMAAAWAAGELPGGKTMLKYSDTYMNTELPPTRPEDQANAILYLASDMSRAVTGRVLTVDNGAFM